MTATEPHRRGARHPGESRRDFIERIADAAPPPSPELAAHLARLLPLPNPTARAGGGDRG